MTTPTIPRTPVDRDLDDTLPEVEPIFAEMADAWAQLQAVLAEGVAA